MRIANIYMDAVTFTVTDVSTGQPVNGLNNVSLGAGLYIDPDTTSVGSFTVQVTNGESSSYGPYGNSSSTGMIVIAPGSGSGSVLVGGASPKS